MKDCRFCGEPMHDRDSFCPHCMRRQDEPDSMENAPISPPILHTRRFHLVLMGIGVLVVSALLIWGRSFAVSDGLLPTAVSTTPEKQTPGSTSASSLQTAIHPDATDATHAPAATQRPDTATTDSITSTAAPEEPPTTVSVTESTVTPSNTYLSPAQIVSYLREELEKSYGHVLCYTETTENLRPHTMLISTQDAYEGSHSMASLLDQAAGAIQLGWWNPTLNLQKHWYHIAFQGQQEGCYLFTVYERMMPIPPLQIDSRTTDDVIAQVVENLSVYIPRIDGYSSVNAVNTGYGFGLDQSSEEHIQLMTAYFLEAVRNGCTAFDLDYQGRSESTVNYGIYLIYE